MEKSIWEDELDKCFFKTKKSDSELLMNILTIVVFNRFDNKIGKLYKIINDESKFSEIIECFSDENIRFPNNKEFKDALLLSLVYYYKVVKHYNWEQIQQELKYEKDIPLRFGKKVSSINGTIKKQLDSLMNENAETSIFD